MSSYKACNHLSKLHQENDLFNSKSTIYQPRLPIHLGTSGDGRVNYAGSFLHLSRHQRSSIQQPKEDTADFSKIILCGGESENVLVYYSPSTWTGYLSSPIQQLDMPMNASIKCMKIIQDINDPSKGIFVAAGGKLSYSIWSFEKIDVVNRNVFHNECVGNLWPQATQDHRTLAVDVISLKPCNTGYPSEADELSPKSHYSLLLCDSRGMVTIAQYSQSQYDFNAAPSIQSNCLNICEQINPYEYPILSCKIFNILTNQHSCINIGVVGDTTGNVRILLLAGSILHNQ
jgi:hypothetical protein